MVEESYFQKMLLVGIFAMTIVITTPGVDVDVGYMIVLACAGLV